MSSKSAKLGSVGNPVRLSAVRVVRCSPADVEKLLCTLPPERIASVPKHIKLEILENREGVVSYKRQLGRRTTLLEYRRTSPTEITMRTESRGGGKPIGAVMEAKLTYMPEGDTTLLRWESALWGTRWWDAWLLRWSPRMVRRNFERTVDDVAKTLGEDHSGGPSENPVA